MNRLDQNSTNRYYASRQQSALRQPRGGIQEGPQGNGIPGSPQRRSASELDERSTDRYYRARLQETSVMKSRIEDIPQGSSTRTVRHNQDVHAVEIDSETAVADGVAEAVRRLQSGQPRVLIRVTGDRQLLQRVRTACDLMVTREYITEEQYRDLVFHRVEPVAQITQQADAPVEEDPREFIRRQAEVPATSCAETCAAEKTDSCCGEKTCAAAPSMPPADDDDSDIA